MAQPPAFARGQRFASYAALFASAPFNASGADTEFDNVKATLDVILSNLAVIQRDDTKLANGSVHLDSFDTDSLLLLSSESWEMRGGWLTATDYALGDIVSNSGIIYFCNEDHTSGTFSTDLAAGKWLLFRASADATELSTPLGFSATNVQDGFDEVANKIYGNINVLEHGAAGDGIENDTAAIVAAIATGQHIYFPPGTYLVDSNIVVANAGQRLFGHRRHSIIQAADPDFNLFSVEASQVSFSGLQFNGAAEDNSTLQYAVFTTPEDPATYLSVDNCSFSGADASHGLNNCVKWDTGSHYGKAFHNDIERLQGAISGTGYGFLVGDADYFKAGTNNAVGSSGRGRHMIYLSSGSSYCELINNSCVSFDEGAFVQSAEGAQDACEDNILIGNIAVGCSAVGTSGSAAIGFYGHSKGAKALFNTVVSSGNHGIIATANGETDMEETVFHGNTVRLSEKVGIENISTVGLLLSANVVNESSQVGAGSHSNIRIASDGVTAPDDVLVTGNHSTGTNNARSPFRIDSTSPTVANIKLAGNYFPTCQLAGIELNGVTCEIDGWLRYAETYDPASIPDGDALTYSSITVAGAEVGDLVLATMTTDTDGVSITGRVTAADTVSVNFLNNSGGAKDIASGTLRIAVLKQNF